MSGVEAIAARARDRATARLARRLRDALPDRAVHETTDGVVIEGRGLRRDARLAWIGSLLR